MWKCKEYFVSLTLWLLDVVHLVQLLVSGL